MKTNDIKNNLHSLIDSIDNDLLLMKLYDLMIKSTSNQEAELWNKLTEEQRDILLLADKESDNPANLISHSQQKKKHLRWL